MLAVTPRSTAACLAAVMVALWQRVSPPAALAAAVLVNAAWIGFVIYRLVRLLG